MVNCEVCGQNFAVFESFVLYEIGHAYKPWVKGLKEKLIGHTLDIF